MTSTNLPRLSLVILTPRTTGEFLSGLAIRLSKASLEFLAKILKSTFLADSLARANHWLGEGIWGRLPRRLHAAQTHLWGGRRSGGEPPPAKKNNPADGSHDSGYNSNFEQETKHLL